MKAKEKAKELVDNFELVERSEKWEDSINLFEAKQCAFICVEELICAFEELSKEESGTTLIDFGQGYWKEVKEEINKL